MKMIKLLLVDDHVGFSQAITRHLRMYDWIEIVGSALNGLEAVTMAAELLPDAVFMDMTMPQMDGAEATRRIKANRPAIYVLLTSHYDDAQHIERAFDAGADAFISKLTILEGMDSSLQTMRAALNSRGNSI
jgi:DNA-binding NarL/FixJ family response regulator